jgi:hypothetical protein
LFPKWSEHDYIAAGKWLATAPETPAKAAAIQRHAETVFAYDPEAAIRWVEGLSEGAERKISE